LSPRERAGQKIGNIPVKFVPFIATGLVDRNRPRVRFIQDATDKIQNATIVGAANRDDLRRFGQPVRNPFTALLEFDQSPGRGRNLLLEVMAGTGKDG